MVDWQVVELELGPELSRFRRRPEKEILRDLGVPIQYYYRAPIFAATLSLFLSMPVFFLAEHMGAVPPMWKDPTWGPILVGWYSACFLVLLCWMYVLPRRVFLAIHSDGFVFQGRIRRHSIRFRDIAECHVISAAVDKILDPETLEELDKAEYRVISPSSTFRLVFADRTQLSWKGMLSLFPVEAALQLLSEIELHKGGTLQDGDVDHVFKRRLHLAGLLVGLMIEAIVVITPVRDEECRAVNHKAFGATFCGLPSEISVPILVGLLFAPLVFVIPQLMVLMVQGLHDKAEKRKALQVVIAGGVYFVILMAAWIIYASMRGI